MKSADFAVENVSGAFRLGVPASVSHDYFRRPASRRPSLMIIFGDRRIFIPIYGVFFPDFGAVRRPLPPTLQTGLWAQEKTKNGGNTHFLGKEYKFLGVKISNPVRKRFFVVVSLEKIAKKNSRLRRAPPFSGSLVRH